MSIGPAPNLSGGMATVMQCCAGAFDSGNGSSFTGLNAAKWLNCNCNSTDCSGPGGGGGEGGGGGGGSCGSGGGSGGLVPNMSTSGLRPNDDIICLGTEIITPCGCEPIPFPGSQQTNRLPFPAPGRVSLYPVVGPPGPRMPLPGYPAPGVLPSPIAGQPVPVAVPNSSAPHSQGVNIFTLGVLTGPFSGMPITCSDTGVTLASNCSTAVFYHDATGTKHYSVPTGTGINCDGNVPTGLLGNSNSADITVATVTIRCHLG